MTNAESLLPELIALLKTDQTPELDGFFIVKLQFSRGITPAGEGLRWRRFPGGQRGAVITHAAGEQTLRAILLEPVEPVFHKSEGPAVVGTPVAELRFSAEAVEAFVRESGDENPNHRGEAAVVPGLLLARTVEAVLRERASFGEEFEFRFLQSLPLNQPLFLVRETESRWVGQSATGGWVLELTLP